MALTYNEIYTDDINIKRKDPNAVVLDIRPVAAYNGWKLENERRGGHIAGAKSFPFEWTGYKDWLKLISSKGADPEKEIVLYGYERQKAEQLASMLLDTGFKKVSIYDHFIDKWSANPNLAMDKLPRYDRLVHPEWLKSLIDKGEAPELENKNYVICHAHYGNIEDYQKGHIPGSIPMDTLDLERPEDWNRRTPEEIRKALEKHGITKDTTVIMYGRFSNPKNKDPKPGKNAGHLASMRCGAIMIYAGVKDVRILNGGLMAWERAGFETTEQVYKPEPVDDFGAEVPQNPDVFVDTPEAKKLLESGDSELVSVRSWFEFIGEVSGYHYIGKKGRIPGSVFGNCGSDAYHMENYRNHDHTMLEYHEVRKNWEEVGIIPEKHIAFYCGTGWRASEAFWNAYLMDWQKISVYDGGWLEWSRDDDNPFEVGDPHKVEK
mgnify:CR=1 FL=1